MSSSPNTRTRRSITQRLLAATALGVSLLAPLAVLQPADAAGTCTAGTNSAGQSVYYCPVWLPSTAGVPVYASTSTGSAIVDRLKSPTGNWFNCQQDGGTATYGSYTSKNWAKTKGDNNGAVGYVPAIYFDGTQNYWPGVASCTAPATTAKTVSYTYYTQDTGYWCGPGATQIALSSWGVKAADGADASAYQARLAQLLGTTTDGTNWITDVVRVLNSEVSRAKGLSAGYQAIFDKSLLKSKIVARVNAGRAVVINVAGGATDRAGVYHYYGGHYLTVVGYSSSGSVLKVADPSDGRYDMDLTVMSNWITGGRGFAA